MKMINLSGEWMEMGSWWIDRLQWTAGTKTRHQEDEMIQTVKSEYTFPHLSHLVLSSSSEWLFCANVGWFGPKLRGNLRVTEPINPEEIQWWSYLCWYWSRCRGRGRPPRHPGDKGRGRAGQGEQEAVCFMHVFVYRQFLRLHRVGSGSVGVWSRKVYHCSKNHLQSDSDGSMYLH